MRILCFVTFVAALLAGPSSALANPNDSPLPTVTQLPALLPELDPKLPRYIPLSGKVKGTIRIAGPALLSRLLERWRGEFQAIYPHVKVEVETLPLDDVFAELVEQRADLVVMPREPNQEESKAFVRRRGQDPTPLDFGLDMQAVIVHHQNPLDAISLDQLAAIYGASPEAKVQQDLTHWTQLGVQNTTSLSPIHPYAHAADTDELATLQRRVLKDIPLKQQVVEKENAAAVVRAVAADPLGIAYVSYSQSRAGVRVVPLVQDGIFYEPKVSNSRLRYPWQRTLSLTTPLLQTDPIAERVDPLLAEFLRFVYSQEGQSGLVREGFAPLPESRAQNGRYSVCPRLQK